MGSTELGAERRKAVPGQKLMFPVSLVMEEEGGSLGMRSSILPPLQGRNYSLKSASSSVWDTDTTLGTLLPLQSGPIFECMSKYLDSIYFCLLP